jgi:ferrous iron transport protein A
MHTLSQLRPNQFGKIVSVVGQSPITTRLRAMGVLPGAQVRVIGLAPLGDPMMVEVNHCRMSLRRAEAASLEVELD